MGPESPALCSVEANTNRDMTRCGIPTDLIVTDQFDASLSHVGGVPFFQKGERGSSLKKNRKKGFKSIRYF
jgi:hypothetical protein